MRSHLHSLVSHGPTFYKLQTYCEWLTVWASVWNLNVLVTRVSWIGWELRRRSCPGGCCLGSSARNGHPSLAIVAVIFCIPSCCCPECLSLISKHLSVLRAVEHVSVWTYGHSLYHKHFFFLCQYGHFLLTMYETTFSSNFIGEFLKPLSLFWFHLFLASIADIRVVIDCLFNVHMCGSCIGLVILRPNLALMSFYWFWNAD